MYMALIYACILINEKRYSISKHNLTQLKIYAFSNYYKGFLASKHFSVQH